MTDSERLFLENTWYPAAWDYQVAEADNRLGCKVRIKFVAQHFIGNRFGNDVLKQFAVVTTEFF